MNTSPLAPFENRWPNDELIAGTEDSFDILQETLHGSEVNESPYLSHLVFDPGDQTAIKTFAADNGLTYTETLPNPPKAAHQPAWYGERSVGTLPIAVHAVSGVIQGYPAEMFLQYTPSTAGHNTRQAGRKIVSLHRRSVIRIQLPKVFPQLVLDSNRNDGKVVGTLATAIKRTQITPLEGTFNKEFDFYAPAGLAIDTRVVLAPNYMQMAMDSAGMFDIEFYGNEIIFVTNQNIYTPETMEAAMRFVNEEIAYLVRLMPSWNYAPHALPFDTLQYNVFRGATNVKIGPLRLGAKTLIAGVILVCILMAVAIVITK